MSRTVSVKLMADCAQFTREVGGRAVGAVKTLSGELDRAGQAGKLDNVTRGMAGLGLGLAGIAGAAVKMNMAFEKSMSAAAAATKAPKAELDKLRSAAIQAGKVTQFSATQAADGITELGKAGVTTQQILGGGLQGALDLAAAGQLSVAEAAETSASALTQFKLQGSAVPHVADLLAAAAGKAQGSVHDMGYALNQSGLVASQFGLKIEDTVGGLAEFANAGLTGSDAGTSFKTMLLAMANPSDITKAKMNDLGVSFYDAKGKFIGLSGVATVLQQSLGGLTEEQRNAALGQIFGNDAIRAATVLYKDGAKGVEEWRSKVNETGYASKTAATLTDNLAGDLERLKGSLETLAIESGGGASGGLRLLTKGANGAVDAFSELPGWLQESITVMSGIGGGGLLAAAGFLKARTTAKDFIDELRDMGPKGTSAAKFLGTVGSWAGKLTLVGTAAFGIYTGMKMFGDWVDHFSAPVARDVDKMTDSMREFASTGKFTGELAKTFGADMKGITQDLAAIQRSRAELARIDATANGPAGQEGRDRAMAALGGKIKQVSAQAKTDIAALDESLANMANEGGVTQAKIAFERFGRAAGLSLSELPKYAAAASNAAAASSGMAQGFGDATSNTKTLTGSLDDAVQAGQKLTEVWKQLHGATLGADHAMLDANGAISDLKKELTESAKAAKNHKLAIDGNSTAALKNRVAVGDAAEAAVKAAQAKYEETGSLTAANKVYDDYIGQLKKTLRHAGLTKKQVDDLIGAYGKMPKSVETDVHLNNSAEAKVEAKLRHLSSMQQALKSSNAIDMRNGFAEGGWTGPGSKFQPAGVVHADEFVVSKSSRGSLEQQKPGALDYMNATGQWPGYAGGGQVWPFAVDVSKTKIPTPPPVPTGGATDDWIVRTVVAHFPGLNYISKFRRGAMTLTGNRSLHSMHRAVDWPANHELALWWHNTYGSRTKELITPWNELNIHNGRPHRYTGAVWNQHNFAGGNAHDHIAMAGGGVIPEHVIGVGKSGRTYEFGEAGPERVTPMRGYASGGLVNIAPSTSTSSARSGSRLDYYDSILSARNAIAQFTAALKENGRHMSLNTQKGRDNRAALISGVRAAQEAAKARYAETGSVRSANKVYDEYIKQLDASMRKMHVNAATRHALIKAYSEKPKYDLPTTADPSNSSGRIKSVQDFASAEEALGNAKTAFAWTKPTFSARTETGRAELQTLFQYLGAAEQAAQAQYQETGNAGSATKLYAGYVSQLRTILMRSGMSKAQVDSLMKQYGRITLTRNRWGGLYEHAASGSLRDAQIAPGGPTRYAWAERETGGEAFIPRHGDKARSLATWRYVGENWLGQSGGRPGPTHITIDAPITFQIGTEAITRHVRIEVDTQLGQVATAVIHQSA